MNIIDGKLLSGKIRNNVKTEIEQEFLGKGIEVPTLAVVLVGNNPASEIYVRNKEKACIEVGIKSIVVKLDENVSQEKLNKEIEKLNQDKTVSGILVQLPLPKQLNSKEVLEKILPEKDVDGLTIYNKGRLYSGDFLVAPCTPSGIISMLDEYKIEVEGKLAVIVGRSELVGKPTEILLGNRNATTILCHRKTQDLKQFTKMADILIVATGNAGLIKADYVKNGVIVIDVGINRIDGKICGDVDFDEVSKKASYITPVPGGVGPMTIAKLLENTLTLARHQKKKN